LIDNWNQQLCLHRKHKKLYDGISDLIVAHLEREAKDRIEPAFPSSSLLNSVATSGQATLSASTPAGASSSKRGPSGTSLGYASTSAASAVGVTAGYGQGRMAQAMEGETFLNAMKSTWQEHKTGMNKISALLKYLVSVSALV
jgi:cullin 3